MIWDYGGVFKKRRVHTRVIEDLANLPGTLGVLMASDPLWRSLWA